MKAVSIDIDFLSQCYFTFDEPVPYKVNNGEILISPIKLKTSGIFLSSIDILGIDKNSSSNVEIIQMSYLQFIVKCLLKESKSKEVHKQKLFNILFMCLGMKQPGIKFDNLGNPLIYDIPTGIEITSKQFDDIKRIIMYQNILHYDDEYIDPELKKAMAETDEILNKGKIAPNLERKIAIISAHNGFSKKDQLDMTYRSHCLLFEEVCGEVNYLSVRPGVIACSGKDEVDSWIFKKEKNRFEGYVRSVDSYTESMGGAQAIRTTGTTVGDTYIQQFNNFNK